jgi:hypothetical protein
MDEVNSLPASPSSSAALVGTVPPKTKNHDQNVASGSLAGKASLSALVNTGSTSAARTNLNLKAVTHATGNGGSENVNGTSLRSTRQAQPSSPHALPAAATPSPLPLQLTSLASLHRHESDLELGLLPRCSIRTKTKKASACPLRTRQSLTRGHVPKVKSGSAKNVIISRSRRYLPR